MFGAQRRWVKIWSDPTGDRGRPAEPKRLARLKHEQVTDLVYVSDFGVMNVVPNRHNRQATILILDMNYWGVAYLRPFQQSELSKTGDSERRMILAEYTLVAKNPLSSGKVMGCVAA